MTGPSRWVESGATVFITPGYPDDGRAYGEITPGSDVAGCSVVVFYRGQHLYGRAVSDPIPGEHIDPTWPMKRRAQYWIEFVEEKDLDEYIAAVSKRREPRPEIIAYAPIMRAWTVPSDGAVPAPRSAGAGAA